MSLNHDKIADLEEDFYFLPPLVIIMLLTFVTLRKEHLGNVMRLLKQGPQAFRVRNTNIIHPINCGLSDEVNRGLQLHLYNIIEGLRPVVL